MKVIPGSGFPETNKRTGSGPDYPPTLLMILLPMLTCDKHSRTICKTFTGRPAAGGGPITKYVDGYLSVIPGDSPWLRCALTASWPPFAPAEPGEAASAAVRRARPGRANWSLKSY